MTRRTRTRRTTPEERQPRLPFLNEDSSAIPPTTNHYTTAPLPVAVMPDCRDDDGMYRPDTYPESWNTDSTLSSEQPFARADSPQFRMYLTYFTDCDFNIPRQPLTERALEALNQDNDQRRFDIRGWCQQAGSLPSAMHMIEAQYIKAKASAVSTIPTHRAVRCKSRNTNTEDCGTIAGADPQSPGPTPSPPADSQAAHICGTGSLFADTTAPILRAMDLDEDDLMNDENAL